MKLKYKDRDGYRICRTCAIEKLLNIENYNHSNDRNPPFRSICKPCDNLRQKKRRLENLHRIKKRNCEECKKIFYVVSTEIKRRFRLFCKRECYHKYRKNKPRNFKNEKHNVNS